MPPNQEQNQPSEPLLPPNLPVTNPEQQPDNPTVTVPTPPIATPSNPQSIYPQPRTTSLSRIEIEAEAAKEDKREFFKKMLVIAPIGLILIAALIVGLLFARNTLFSNLNTKTITNDGYTYTFKFYKQAQSTTIEGIQGSVWKISSGSVVSATPKPTSDALSSSCNGLQKLTTNSQGLTEGEAFITSIGGSSQPVCMEENSTIQIFEAHFNAAGRNHFLLLLYSKDPQSASDYPTIKKIFNSVKVSET